MLECYERIAHHFLDESDEFGISDTKKAELQQELQELEEVKKQITEYLQDRLRSLKIQHSIDRRKSAKSDMEKNEKVRDVQLGARQLSDIEQLQKALNNFDKNVRGDVRGDMVVLRKDAENKLKQAHKKGEFKSETWNEAAVEDHMYLKISEYLSRQRVAIAKVRLNENLEKAYYDMLKYSKALHLDKVLEHYREISAGVKAPIKRTGKQVNFNKQDGPSFDTFLCQVSFVENVEKIGMSGKDPIVQKIECIPDFFLEDKCGLDILGDKCSQIGIAGVKRCKNTYTDIAGRMFDCKFEELEGYRWANLDKCRELLDLLQGLASPAKTLLHLSID